MCLVLGESKSPLPDLKSYLSRGRRETKQTPCSTHADVISSFCLSSRPKHQPGSRSMLYLLHMVKPGSSSLHWFCWQDKNQCGHASLCSRCPFTLTYSSTHQGHHHRHIHITVPWLERKTLKKKGASVGEKPQRESTAQHVGNWCSPKCFPFCSLVSLLLPRQWSQLLLQSQLTVLPLTQIPTRERGIGMANPPRTAASLKLFVFMDRDAELRQWIVKSLLARRMLHYEKKKKSNSERRKGWKYLSFNNTDKKQTLAAATYAMPCLCQHWLQLLFGSEAQQIVCSSEPSRLW